MSSVVAAAGVFLLASVAPFETTNPLVRLPGQDVSNLEAALLVALVLWAGAVIWSGRLPEWRVPLAAPWAALVAVMTLAAVAGPQRTNALHMVGRFAAAAAVYLLAIHGVTTRARLYTALTICVASGVIVAALAMLEYLEVGPVLRVLQVFRPSVVSVGAHIRAGGPLQYPTITSMYLEIVFAFGLGLMLSAIDAGARVRAVLSGVALVAIAEAIALTFTRAGLLTMAVSLGAIGALRFRARGFDGGTRALAGVAVVIALLLVASRPLQTAWLRLTTEGQDDWYRARIEAPADLTFATERPQYVTVEVSNTGRLVWDSTGASPIYLSYHWLEADRDRVIAYNGARTSFDRPVRPGETVSVPALVRGLPQPGAYRLEWDLVQENRLWFSTEQGAPESTMSRAAVTGQGHGGPLTTMERPRRAVRPGRWVLWGAAVRMIAAHPILGVGPDNFRLLYGQSARLSGADTRTHTNNMYLEILVGGGVLAAAVFAWFLRDAFALFAMGSDPNSGGRRAIRGQTPIGMGIAAAGGAIALHGTVDSFLSFAPTYILFALTLGFAAAVARGAEMAEHAHRV